ncbi:hypothetical protein AAFF_G00160810 [Aldrovandia affinis]|uniref:Uncharacterized protein n=1 Tax=Aldrovandia affinis TaxID=143900 RepID=A0AAD7RQG0_9TELE|nr:hypothetical protein AAFF_G00160810 [Aldrovandia affinis]
MRLEELSCGAAARNVCACGRQCGGRLRRRHACPVALSVPGKGQEVTGTPRCFEHRELQGTDGEGTVNRPANQSIKSEPQRVAAGLKVSAVFLVLTVPLSIAEWRFEKRRCERWYRCLRVRSGALLRLAYFPQRHGGNSLCAEIVLRGKVTVWTLPGVWVTGSAGERAAAGQTTVSRTAVSLIASLITTRLYILMGCGFLTLRS